MPHTAVPLQTTNASPTMAEQTAHLLLWPPQPRDTCAGQVAVLMQCHSGTTPSPVLPQYRGPTTACTAPHGWLHDTLSLLPSPGGPQKALQGSTCCVVAVCGTVGEGCCLVEGPLVLTAHLLFLLWCEVVLQDSTAAGSTQAQYNRLQARATAITLCAWLSTEQQQQPGSP
jgi:hypothetical protein